MKKSLLKILIACLSISFPGSINAQNTLNRNGTSVAADSFMLWKGRFEKGKFICENGAVITMDPKTKDPQVNFPQGKDPMKTVIDEIDKTNDAEKELQDAARGDENGVKFYPVVAESIKLYEQLKEETKSIVLQDIDWGDDEFPSFRPLGPTGMKDFLLNTVCPKARPVYDEVMSYVDKIKHDQNPDIPIPPTADYFNCWGCDKKKRDDYDLAVKKYVKDFFKEESKEIRNSLGLMRLLVLLFGKDVSFDGAVSKGGWDPSMQSAIDDAIGSSKHPTFCTFIGDASYHLQEAVHEIVSYAIKKADLLAKKYLKADYDLQLEPVILVCLNISRQAALLGQDGREDYFLQTAGNACKALFDDWSNRKTSTNDYTRFADIPFILGILRQAELLSGTDYGISKKLLSLMDEDDRFRITIDVETSVGHSPVFQKMQYHSDGYLMAVWDEDSTGCLKWIPVSAKGNKNMMIYTQLRQAEVTGPAPHLEYVGTHDFYLNFTLKANFCKDPQADTLWVKTQLLSDPATGYKWSIAGREAAGGPFERFSGFSLFIDPMKSGMEMKREAETGELQKKLQQNLATSQQALEKAKAFQQLQQSGANSAELGQKLSDTFQSTTNANNGVNNLQVEAAVFPVNVSNKEKVLIDQTFEASDFNPTAAAQGLISVGKVKVRLEYIAHQ